MNNKIQDVATIFVVIEGDRGMGETLLAAYPTLQMAEEHAKESGHYYVQECPFGGTLEPELHNL